MFYVTKHSTHFLYGLFIYSGKKEGRKEMFYLTKHSTHFLCGYVASGIWYMATQIARGNPLPPLHGLTFSSRSSQVRVFNVHIQSKLL